MYVLQPKTDQQGSKLPFTNFRSTGPDIVENALAKNNYLFRKVQTNKTHYLHRMRLRLFRPGKPILEVQITSQEWKPDTETIIKHNKLYTRAWESEYETPFFDNDRDETDNHTSLEITVRHGLANGETCVIPVTIQEGSPEI